MRTQQKKEKSEFLINGVEKVVVDHSIYQVTAADLQAASAEQAKRANESQLFIPKSERESLKEKKLAKYSKCQVKYDFLPIFIVLFMIDNLQNPFSRSI